MRSIVVMLVVVILAGATQPALATSKSSSEAAAWLAGKAVKRLALPLAIILAAPDANAAYAYCDHYADGEDRAACATEVFLIREAEDIAEIVDEIRFLVLYGVIPEAEAFWDQHGDDIKRGASKAADVMIDGAIRFVVWALED